MHHQNRQLLYPNISKTEHIGELEYSETQTNLTHITHGENRRKQAFSDFCTALFMSKEVSMGSLSCEYNLKKVTGIVLRVILCNWDTMSAFEFLNGLLYVQGKQPVDPYGTPVKLLMIFVHLFQELQPHDQFPSLGLLSIREADILGANYVRLFTKTVKETRKNSWHIAESQRKVLVELRRKCIGTRLTPSEGPKQQSSPVYRAPPRNPAPVNTTIQPPKPLPKPHPILLPTPDEEILELFSDPEDENAFNTYMTTQIDWLSKFRLFRRELQHPRFGGNPVQCHNLVGNLVDSFSSGHRIGNFNLYHTFLEILLEVERLNNAGRKVVLWTLATILGQATKPMKLLQQEAAQVKTIIEGYNVKGSVGDPRKIIELLAISGRLERYVPAEYSNKPLDECVSILIGRKYRWIGSNPCRSIAHLPLNFGHFYPLDAPNIDKVSKAVLKEIRQDWRSIPRRVRQSVHFQN